MTTTPLTTQAPPARPAGQRVTLARVVRSEWTKLRSLPSGRWSLLIALASIVGFGALYSLLRVTRPPDDPAALAAFDPTAVSLSGVQLAHLAVGVLGVLLVAGEYATGLIRTSLTAVPARLPVLWAKAIVFALTTLAVCLPATAAAFLVGQSILSERRLDIPLGHPGVARPTTTALPHSTGSRRGTAAKLTRIVPVAYSPVTTSTPRTPTASSASWTPARLTAVGSKLATAAGSLGGRVTRSRE